MLRTMLFQYVLYNNAMPKTCHWIMENIFIEAKQKKICRQRRKTQFSFYQDHQFHKIEDLPYNAKSKMFSIDCITTKSLIFFIIRCWSSELIVSNFCLFSQQYNIQCDFFCVNIMWYAMKWVSSIVCNPCTHPHNNKKKSINAKTF